MYIVAPFEDGECLTEHEDYAFSKGEAEWVAQHLRENKGFTDIRIGLQIRDEDGGLIDVDWEEYVSR